MPSNLARTLVIACLILFLASATANTLLTLPKVSFTASLFNLSRLLAWVACLYLILRSAPAARIVVPALMALFVLQWLWLNAPLVLRRAQSLFSGTADSAYVIGLITGQLLYLASIIAIGLWSARHADTPKPA